MSQKPTWSLEPCLKQNTMQANSYDSSRSKYFAARLSDNYDKITPFNGDEAIRPNDEGSSAIVSKVEVIPSIKEHSVDGKSTSPSIHDPFHGKESHSLLSSNTFTVPGNGDIDFISIVVNKEFRKEKPIIDATNFLLLVRILHKEFMTQLRISPNQFKVKKRSRFTEFVSKHLVRKYKLSLSHVVRTIGPWKKFMKQNNFQVALTCKFFYLHYTTSILEPGLRNGVLSNHPCHFEGRYVCFSLVCLSVF